MTLGQGRDLVWGTAAPRVPEAHEVHVEVAYSGICGSDLSIVGGHWPRSWRPGRVMGHEASGVVVGLGSGVDDLTVGDRVTWEPLGTCGRCDGCREGRPELCGAPVIHEGSWARDAVVPRRAVHRLPDGVDLLTGALAEPLACCLEAYEQAGVRLDDDVVVVGTGALGLMLAALAVLGGARSVVVVARSEEKARLARSVGATATVTGAGGPEATRDEVVALLGRRPDVVFEAAGAPAAVELALALPKRGGRVVLVGAGHPGETVPLEPHAMYVNATTVSCSYSQNGRMARAVRLLERLPLRELVTDVVPLEEFERGLERAATRGAVKVLFAASAHGEGSRVSA